MKYLSIRACMPAFTAMVFAASAFAQSGTGGAGTGATNPSAQPATAGERQSTLSRADRGFLEQAAQNGHAEVESSKLALTKAQNPEVKSFAQKMVEDHTKTGNELAALATSKGVEVPKEPSLMQKAKMKLLSTADGENFDRRYAKSMGVEAHEETLELFRKAASEAKDADVKAFASKTVPALEEHMKMARQLEMAVDPGASASGTGSGNTNASGTAGGAGMGGSGQK